MSGDLHRAAACHDLQAERDQARAALAAAHTREAALRADVERLTAILNEPPKAETVHACPPGDSGIMPCCGRTPFEAVDDRMTIYPVLVTCRALDGTDQEPGDAT